MLHPHRTTVTAVRGPALASHPSPATRARAALVAGLCLGLGMPACAPVGEKAVEVPSDLVIREGAEPPHVQHWHRWSDHLAHGAQPETDQDFADLRAAGITTILSVDGSMPDVEAASRHGLRYVHIPIGYDGVARDEELKIVKAVEASEGPVYVHCHHGLHRGPAAAMIARIATEGVDPAQAVKDLGESGCSPSYAGLFRDVGAFRPPTPEQLAAVPADLPAAVRPAGFREVMTHVDQHWEHVKAASSAAFQPSPEHPDIDPAHEIGMIENQLRLAKDLQDAEARGPGFLAAIEHARALAQGLEDAIRAGDASRAETAFQEMSSSCSACHKAYRN